MNAGDKEDSLTLEILRAIEEQEGVTQRHLSQRLGIALGLANSYLKRCVRKGLIKIQQAPANRYLYYLTPQGFSEKSRLTAKYLASSLKFYRLASESCARVFAECEQDGWHDVVLCGVSELAEIAVLVAYDRCVEIKGVFDRECFSTSLNDKPVYRDFAEIARSDAFVITDLGNPLATLYSLRGQTAGERVLVPDVLGISR